MSASRSLPTMATPVRLVLVTVLVLAYSGTAQNIANSPATSTSSGSTSSAEIVPSSPVTVALSREQITSWIVGSIDRLNGGQFVELLDPLMDGQLSRIMASIKRKYPESFTQLASAADLPARHFLRILDIVSDGQVAAALHGSFPTLFERPRRASLDTMSGLSLGYAKKRSLDPMSGVSFGAPSKRYSGNFDEMDRTGFSGFAKRRSEFDEMDRSGFSGFAKRRSDFDEIDRAGFSGFAKRRSEFDELDHSGFSGFAKRRSEFDEMDRSGFSGFAKKRFNFDELDRVSGFTGFMHKRAPMAPLASMKAALNARQMQVPFLKQQSAASSKQESKA